MCNIHKILGSGQDQNIIKRTITTKMMRDTKIYYKIVYQTIDRK